MAIVRGESFEDAFEGPFSAEVILSNYLLDLSEDVHDALTKAGMSQRDLAKKLGKKPSQITRMLSGEANVTLRTIAELDSALELDLEIRPRVEQVASMSVTSSYTTNNDCAAGHWPANVVSDRAVPERDSSQLNVCFNGRAIPFSVGHGRGFDGKDGVAA